MVIYKSRRFIGGHVSLNGQKSIGLETVLDMGAFPGENAIIDFYKILGEIVGVLLMHISLYRKSARRQKILLRRRTVSRIDHNAQSIQFNVEIMKRTHARCILPRFKFSRAVEHQANSREGIGEGVRSLEDVLLVEGQTEPVVGSPLVVLCLDVGKYREMFGSARFEGNRSVIAGSLADDRACQVAHPSFDVKWVVGQVVLRMARVKINGEHERLAVRLSLFCCYRCRRRVLPHYRLLDGFHCIFLKNHHQSLDEERPYSQNEDEGGYDAAAAVVLGLLADPPELGVGKQVEDFEDIEEHLS